MKKVNIIICVLLVVIICLQVYLISEVKSLDQDVSIGHGTIVQRIDAMTSTMYDVRNRIDAITSDIQELENGLDDELK